VGAGTVRPTLPIRCYEHLLDSMDLLETSALIALVRRGDRAWHHYADAVESTGSALAVLRGEPPDELAPLTLFESREPAEEPDLDPIVTEIKGWQREGMRVLSVLDDGYPTNLRSVHNRPPFVFVRGELHPDDDRSIAVVGTRRASDEGLRQAGVVAGGLAEAGFTVVSGLAAGIDSAAHQAALERRRRTVAVIGTGLRRTYPAQNAVLQERIAADGAVVSQFWPDAPPTKTSFPMRNVVMSGLALGTVVVEASRTSGAKMQARFALEHGRPVFLLESLLQHEWAREYADRPGAHVVRRADDVIEHVERLTSLDTLMA
jgi:DNA processing protein